jgi:hypothetical protein
MSQYLAEQSDGREMRCKVCVHGCTSISELYEVSRNTPFSTAMYVVILYINLLKPSGYYMYRHV